MKNLAIIITLVVTGTSLLFLGGCKHHRGGQERLSFVMDYIDEVLDLNSAQEQELEKIRTELVSKARTLRDSKQKMMPMLKEQLASDKIDTAKIKQAVTEHRRQLDQVIDLAIDRLAEFHASLSPVQRQKLVAKLDKMEQCHTAQADK